jgi:hypothetical protein
MEEKVLEHLEQFIKDEIRALPVAPPTYPQSMPTLSALHHEIVVMLSVPSVQGLSKERLFLAMLSKYKEMLQYYEYHFFLWKLPESQITPTFGQYYQDMFEHLNEWFLFLNQEKLKSWRRHPPSSFWALSSSFEQIRPLILHVPSPREPSQQHEFALQSFDLVCDSRHTLINSGFLEYCIFGNLFFRTR